jgi:hypothetical protein
MNNCPLCNGDLVNVIYGYPTPALIEMAKTDGIVLGGTPTGFRPTHYCHVCQEQFPRQESLFSDPE